jgi:hypothetical protein
LIKNQVYVEELHHLAWSHPPLEREGTIETVLNLRLTAEGKFIKFNNEKPTTAGTY